MRRVGALFPIAESDPEQAARRTALQQTLERLGWMEGKNVRLDFRFAGSPDRFSPLAKEIVAQQPDVIFAQTPGVVAAVKRETQTIPIVFKEVAPRITRVAVLFNPTIAVTFAEYYLNPVKAAAASLGVEAIAAPVHDTSELEPVVAAQAREPNSGLIVIPDAFTIGHRAEVTSLAARYQLPAVYPYRQFAELGGLLSYGFDRLDNWRRAAGYVDRILKGEKPADLPVQAPTKYELVLNLKTAKALGLDVPWILQQRADEVIE